MSMLSHSRSARISVMRFSTTPKLPLPSWCTSSTTVRWKLGSSSCGIATRSEGAIDALATAQHSR
jgi:hypothetical protein